MAVSSVPTKSGMDGCRAAAAIPCLRPTKRKTGQGQAWRWQADEGSEGVAERPARKQAEPRVLNVQPKAYVWRKDMTKAEPGYLKGLLEGQQVRLKDGK